MDPSTLAEPVLCVCKAWSHTQRRQMLTLYSQAADSDHGRAELQRALAGAEKGAFFARVAPVPDI